MSYLASLIERYPPGTKVFGDCPRPRQKAKNTEGRMAAAGTKRGILGDNSEAKTLDEVIDDFDAIAAANLKRGLYRTRDECWRLASNDPRCTRRHLRVLGIVFGFMRSDSGLAYPDGQAIAAKTAVFSGDVPDPDGGHDHGTIRNLLSDLQVWGYLPSARRGPEGGGRALAHYTVGLPGNERLAREVAAYLRGHAEKAKKETERIERFKERRRHSADVTTPDDIRNIADVTTPDDVTQFLVTSERRLMSRGGVRLMSRGVVDRN